MNRDYIDTDRYNQKETHDNSATHNDEIRPRDFNTQSIIC